ncbi:Ecm29p [Sugiyamaella lignohabitans]|uniref:Ecm29p n=1 Tax=Sugiyamaella lignohabitans TaxID=796027 RepID=A0A167CI96_9ASCO|nr:Ecm29p [Sugiyamaella lignohabitans]ANB11735.1 Ecm29p [Sugiyamaella lignohabitans]
MLLTGAFAGPKKEDAKLSPLAELTFFPLLVASHDRITDIFRPADEALRRLIPQFDLERLPVVEKLYALALGDITTPPVKQVVQTHIVQLIAKSKVGVNVGDGPKRLIQMSFESDNIKSMKAGVELIRAVARNTDEEKLKPVARELARRLYEWIISTGWPRLNTGSSAAKDMHTGSLRRQTYETLGALARRVPEILNDNSEDVGNLGLIKFLFESLAKDSPDMKPSIQEALSEVIPVLDVISEDARPALNELLFSYLSDPTSDQGCKYVSIRYAVRVTPFNNAMARLLCLYGLDRANRPDVIEEAKRGLHPYWYHNANSHYNNQDVSNVEFPSFQDMLAIVQERMFVQSANGPQLKTPFNVLNFALIFLEQILVMEAVKGKTSVLQATEENWDTTLDTAIVVDQNVRGLFRDYINSAIPLDQLISFIDMNLWASKQNSAELPDAVKIWLRILSQSGPKIISENIPKIPEIVALVDSAKAKLLQASANALAIIITTDEVAIQDIVNLIESWISQAGSSGTSITSFKHRGHLYAIGYIISRLALRNRKLPEEVYAKSVKAITDVILQTRSADVLTMEAAVDAFSQLALSGAVNSDFVTPEVISKLLTLAKADNDKAIFAVGCITSTAATESKQKYIDAIFELHTGKQIDFMFMSGEALSIAAAGWDSTLGERYRDIQGVNLLSPSTTSQLGSVLDQVLVKCSSPKPSLRRFSCVWLLSLTRYCGHLPEARSRLEQVHLAFMKFLVDRDDVVQESASRGLSIVYDIADSKLKDSMIRGLVQSFTSDKLATNGGTVTAETQLFEPGVLDTGDGSISTYKDILSLASEVGDPSLVYKFMSLAANSSLWQSRKGAAFGLNTIFSKANLDDLFESNPKLSKNLIPKLYRYRFDPNSSVQESMKGIWNALVRDNTAVINNNFIDILEELLTGMGNREWRIRQASTMALSDLLQGKLLQQYEHYLQRIWLMSFRVVDDIKESVRVAGMQLTRGLTTSLVRHVDVQSGAASEKQAANILKDLIPFLMGNSGIQSESQEVQSFSLQTLLKLCKSNSPPLKPYIPGLIEELLGLLSTLEPQAMNYLALNADKYGLTSNDIDASRMSSLRTSPMMEAIEQMIERLDDESLEALIPKLSSVIKKSVGLPSKLGAGRVVVSLVMRNLYQIGPHSQALLLAAKSQLMDRNSLVSQSYAVSCGYLCRPAPVEAVLDYVAYLQKLYFSSPDVGERARLVSGLGVNGISKHASDKFSAISSAMLPFVFIAKHDPDAQVKEAFEHVWSDNTGGTGAIRLYVNEIIAIVRENLSSQQWDIRQVAAKSVADAAVAMGEETRSDSVPQDILELFNVLIQASSGRSWKGKEIVFDALVTLAVNFKGSVVSSPELLEKLNSVVVTEVKRRNKEYQVEVIQSAGKYISQLNQSQLYELLFEVSSQYLDPTLNESDEDSDGDTNMEDGENNSGPTEDVRLKVLKGVVKSVTLGNNNGVVDTIAGYLINALEHSKAPITWKTKLAVAQHAISITELFSGEVDSKDADSLLKIWKAIVKVCSRDLNHEKVRIESARVGAALLKILPGNQEVRNDIETLIGEEKSTIVLTELRKGIQ